MKTRGITLVEAVVAAAALTLVLGVFTTLIVGNMKQTTIVGARTQANQLGIFLGRQVIEGDNKVLADQGQSKTWAYGSLSNITTGFSTLTQERQFGDITLYRAEISNRGAPSWASSTWQVNQYRINVCWRSPEGEKCIQQDIIGPSPSSASSETVTYIN